MTRLGYRKGNRIETCGDVAAIYTSRGHVILCDTADLPLLSRYTWRAVFKKDNGYAISTPKQSGPTLKMHSLVCNPPPGLEVDHINRNGLDNRRSNLRPATHAENTRNVFFGNNTSGYKGVAWDIQSQAWQASICADGLQRTLGRYESKEDAARAYNRAAKQLHGAYAVLNPVNDSITPVRLRRPHGGWYQLAKTHCPQGHPYDAQNTGHKGRNRARYCLTCDRERHQAARHRRRLAG